MNESKQIEKSKNAGIAVVDDELLRGFGGGYNLSDNQMRQFLEVSKAFALNPFKKEIHIVKYKDKFDLIVGYQTYIQRAERSGLLDGWNVDVSQDGNQAKITIYRKDFSKPFTWTVDRSDFDKKRSTWADMPIFMLKKIAIGQGFRLCFPTELGGMPHTEAETEIINASTGPARVVDKQAAQIPTGAFERKTIEEKNGADQPPKMDAKTEKVREAFKTAFEKAGYDLVNDLNGEVIQDWGVEGGIDALTIKQMKDIAVSHGVKSDGK